MAACLAVVVAGAFGCAENAGPVEPHLTPGIAGFDHSEVVNTEVSVLERNEALSKDLVVRGHIGPDGGDLKIREAGLQVSFPAGAVSSHTEFTLIARKGKGLIYEFYPSPLSFPVPVKIEVDLRNTTAYKNATLMNALEGAYFPGDGAAEFNADGTVRVTELVPVNADVKTGKIKFFVHHFSGYLVASGRGDAF